MPRFDKTGPEGKGAQTGRKMGKCNLENISSDETLLGKGVGRGQGRGRSNGNKRGRGLENGQGMGRR